MEYNFEKIWNKSLRYNIEQKPEEFKQLLNKLNTSKNKKYALEIGSNYGGTAYALCHIYDFVFTIDIKHHDNFDKIKQEFPNYNYIISDSTSNDTINFIKNLGIQFDFIFIDGDHSYDGVKNDYDKYKQFLSDNGYLGFHDIVKSSETEKYGIYVNKFWSEIITSYNENYEFISPSKTYEYSYDNDFHELLKNQNYNLWGGIGLIKNYKVSIFVHNYLENNWNEIVDSQLYKLINFGLYKRADKIFFGVYSYSDENFELFTKLVKKIDIDLKIEICRYTNNNYEFDTLIHLQNYTSINKNGSVVYYHTKGSSREKNSYIESWRECLEYFIIEKWNLCHEILLNNKSDICGALYVTWFKFLNYYFENYFSGNFWWSTSKYINTLPPIQKTMLEKPENRTVAEMWLGMSPHVWNSLYNEQVSNYYEHFFDPKKYRLQFDN